MLTVQIPFSGFYESIWSQTIDQEETQFIEWQEQENWPSFPDIAALAPELRPAIGWPGLAEIIYDNARYSAAYAAIAQNYHAAFWDIIADQLGAPVPAEWDGMTSPREYNFETDRIFSKVSESVMQAMLDAVPADTLAAAIRARHTSRSGFISFYGTDITEWLAKPLAEWDHNELGTLLIAYIDHAGICDNSESIGWHIYDSCNADEWAYNAWDSCVDWQAVESALADMCDDIAAEAGLSPADVPYRCPLTLELPLNGASVA